ncbi:MAG TPA: 30S ribosomal protein S6 [Candidatus Paceibacterota bacterium]|nr:30S ribosomal protein S6 [Candidatus Paceibacterota bacterium]
MVEPRHYEFACHFTTQLDEALVPQLWAQVTQTITKHGGIITAEQPPQPQRLSYDIKHQRRSFFAWAQFSTEQEELLQDLEEWCRLHPEVLRYLVLKLEAESDKRAAKQAAHLERKAAKQAKEGSLQKKTVVEKKAEDTGKLEEQIEEALENI